MHIYTSGTPDNDDFQVIENQLCSHRLFSMHGQYAPQVLRWIDLLRRGIHTFEDYEKDQVALARRLAVEDRKARQKLAELGVAERWTPHVEALRDLSRRLGPTYPRNIMLDSGAFTAWNAGAPAALDDVRQAYAEFLKRGDGLFDNVWLVNLDVIAGTKSETKKKPEPTPAEIAAAIETSDRNYAVLRSEFGDRVIPVFHQGEDFSRLKEVVEQSSGFVCLSPTNGLPEEERWRWAKLASNALRTFGRAPRTHGLATTGSVMVRSARLHSGDSAAWKRHAGFGVVDLVEGEEFLANRVRLHPFIDKALSREVVKGEQLRYRAYHIAIDRNDRDRVTGEALIDSPRHFAHLSETDRQSVRERVEVYFPFPMAQLSGRARALICLAEIQAFAKAAGPKQSNLHFVSDDTLELLHRRPERPDPAPRRRHDHAPVTKLTVTPGAAAAPLPILDGDWMPAPAGLVAGLNTARRFTGKPRRDHPWVQYVYLVEGRLLASDNLSIVEIDLEAPTLGPARFDADDVALLTLMGNPDHVAIARGALMFRWQRGAWCRFEMQLAGLPFAHECRSILERWWSPPRDDRSHGGWNASILKKVTQVADALDTRRSPATFCFARGRGLMIKPHSENVAA